MDSSGRMARDGPGSTLASDGTWTYTWDPSGTSLAGIGVAGGSASQGTIAYTDAQDLSNRMFAAAGAPDDAVANYYRSFNQYIYRSGQ